MTQKPSKGICCKHCALYTFDICTHLDIYHSIQRYSVIPLSPNSGLIGWVPHCDTLHTLFKEYREKKKIMLNIEHRLMLQVHYLDVKLVDKLTMYKFCFKTLIEALLLLDVIPVYFRCLKIMIT